MSGPVPAMLHASEKRPGYRRPRGNKSLLILRGNVILFGETDELRADGALDVRILIVDDHLVVREGAAWLLQAAITSLQVHEAEDADAALSAYGERPFDVVVVDVNLPGKDGYRLLESLFAADDRVRVLMFSMHEEAGYVGRALRLGARGYVSKSAPAEELIAAVRAIAAGSRYVESRLAAELEAIELQDETSLTPRENEILRLLGEGKSVREIAAECGRTYKTISNCLGGMKSKLGVRSAADLVRISISESMRRPDDE